MKLTTGEKIWILSVILYLIWIIIGIKLDYSYFNISVIGSIGMILFVVIFNLLRFVKI
jgi:hypothetical protein